MLQEHVHELLEKLGCDRIKATHQGWLNASCPFAPFSDSHKNKKDAHPSFGVSVGEKRSGYRCFTCNAKGSLPDLVFRLQNLAAQKGHQTSGFYELIGWIRENDKGVEPTPADLRSRLEAASYKTYRAVEVGGIKLSEKAASKVLRNGGDEAAPETFIEETELAAMDALSDEARDYLLQERGLTEQSITDFELRWHAKARRIAIPIRDCAGRLVGISGRSIDPRTRPKFLHSAGYNRDRYLYGEHKLVEGWTGPGVVVEGFFDAIHLWQHGYRAVAILGSYPSSIQIEKLVRFFGEVVVIPDGDAVGAEAADRIKQALGKRLRVRITPMRAGADPDDLSPLDLAEMLGPPTR